MALMDRFERGRTKKGDARLWAIVLQVALISVVVVTKAEKKGILLLIH
jgi:hypothetical protein